MWNTREMEKSKTCNQYSLNRKKKCDFNTYRNNKT